METNHGVKKAGERNIRSSAGFCDNSIVCTFDVELVFIPAQWCCHSLLFARAPHCLRLAHGMKINSVLLASTPESGLKRFLCGFDLSLPLQVVFLVPFWHSFNIQGWIHNNRIQTVPRSTVARVGGFRLKFCSIRPHSPGHL